MSSVEYGSSKYFTFSQYVVSVISFCPSWEDLAPSGILEINEAVACLFMGKCKSHMAPPSWLVFLPHASFKDDMKEMPDTGHVFAKLYICKSSTFWKYLFTDWITSGAKRFRWLQYLGPFIGWSESDSRWPGCASQQWRQSFFQVPVALIDNVESDQLYFLLLSQRLRLGDGVGLRMSSNL